MFETLRLFLSPYVQLGRFDKPVGIWLLMLPCWWGAALASSGAIEVPLLLTFMVGALLMRSAGCTINDIIDRDIDKKVARTAQRPLASGRLSLFQAAVFLGLLLLLGLGVLLTLNDFTILLGIGVLPLIVIYPLMKRITYFPQVILGLTFNWGALMGWSAVTGSLQAPAVILYAAGVFWTLGYDTIYAHQDRQDDAVIGVKSTALKFGANTKAWVAGFYTLTLSLVGLAGWMVAMNPWFYVGLAVCAAHFAWQVADLRVDDEADCLNKFTSNTWAGILIAVAIIAGAMG